MLRDSNLINGILFNSEVWYGMLQRHIEKLEKLDEIFLRSLLDAHSKTASEALYIETGKMPIRFVIKMRRLMYWWHLNNSDENLLINRCYRAQRNNPIKKDWINDVESDKKEFNIKMSDDEVKNISSSKFK